MVGVMDGAGEGSTTKINSPQGAVFGFGNDGRGQGEWGIMVGGAGVDGNEKEVKSSETSHREVIKIAKRDLCKLFC